MARRIDKEKALKLRMEGKSYSQIKAELNVPKGTLSGWLAEFPLSSERIKELRDKNPERIEKCRNTKLLKKEEGLRKVYELVCRDLQNFTEREVFIAGLFLYWGEGLKSQRYTAAVANTDPSIIRFFIKWLELFDIKKERLNVVLHLYKDMDINKELDYWSNGIGLPVKQFGRIQIKNSNLCDITYRNGFGHGTCNIRLFEKETSDYIRASILRLREIYV